MECITASFSDRGRIRHLDLAFATRPVMTVARDMEDKRDLSRTLDQGIGCLNSLSTLLWFQKTRR